MKRAEAHAAARALLESTIVGALEQRAQKCEAWHGEVAGSVAETLFGKPGEEEEKPMATGLRGKGMWMREVDDISASRARELGLNFVVIAGFHGGRPVNRSAAVKAWAAEFIKLGGVVWVYDWLPTPQQGTGHLPELAAWAASIGARGLMVDAEPDAGWRTASQAARTYAHALQTAARAWGMRTAYTDYGRGGNNDATMRAFLEVLDGGVPQSYDPNGEYLSTYHKRSADYWKERGAKEVIIGLGGWFRSADRHRTPQEFLKHLESGLPSDTQAVIFWYTPDTSGTTAALERLLPVLRDFPLPGDMPSPIDALTPFGVALRDWLA